MKHMTNSNDRQGILDNLTGIETTAKLLVNAFLKKNSHNTELALNDIHQEELVIQTKTFLQQAQKLIGNLSITLNLTTDNIFKKKLKQTSELVDITPNKSDVSQNEGNHITSPSTTKTYSLSSVTLDDIIQNRLALKHLLPNYPLLHDPIQPNLVAIARFLRQIDDLDDLILRVYSKIFNHEEQTCCSYDGINGKLPYPRHKRLLFDLIIKLTLIERNKTFIDNDKHQFYTRCEKHFSTETPLTKYRGLNIDHFDRINSLDNEKEFVCSLFRLIIPQDDIKRIISAKKDVASQWNDNEICIYYARPIHLLWIKQKWLERYPSNDNNEVQRWSECINWAIDSFLETPKIRPSKRKTMEVSTNHKRKKTSFTLEEKFQDIDRTKFDVLEYGNQLICIISDENKTSLPTFEQLQLLESTIFRFYWTLNQQKTWSQILNMIENIFEMKSKDNFRYFYAKQLLETDANDQIEIERLLQIIL